MEGKILKFTWSDGWWIEDNKGWFVDGRSNALFCVNLDTSECKKLDCIPDTGERTYRLNPYCIKCDRNIYCIPGFGRYIWIYNLDNSTFTKVDMNRSEKCLPGSRFWVWRNAVFIVPVNWNKIIEINVEQGEITNYYTICEDDTVQRSVLIDDSIYAVSSEKGKIYQFDLKTKEKKTHLIIGIEEKLFAVCFDGKKFWLSGYKEKVYVWDKERDKLISISFPRNYKNEKNTYKLPMFERIVAVGEYIWFIPIGAEKIMYMNRDTTELSIFEIFEKDRISVSLQKCQEIANYIFQYVRDGRYIGLFSAKNSRILEIDTEQLSYQWKEYYFSEQFLQQCVTSGEGIYYEGKDPLYIQIYHVQNGTMWLRQRHVDIDSVGMQIHTKLIKERLS